MQQNLRKGFIIYNETKYRNISIKYNVYSEKQLKDIEILLTI